MNKPEADHDALTFVVIAGAVARGSYEAGALAELLPRFVPDLRNTVFIGTSAGAINAALWASYAHLGHPAAGEAVKNVWLSIEDKDVFAPLLRTGARDALGLAWGFANGKGLRSLLDTAPLERTVKRELHTARIAKNLQDKIFRGVGVVATACGEVVAGARSHVFLQYEPLRLGLPRAKRRTPLNYFHEKLSAQHILASAAVPVMFPPVSIKAPRGSKRVEQVYVDGGVRLNTPIKPAIDLKAARIIVVSSHVASYPPETPSAKSIGMDDSLALILHSMLADGMVEDLHKLRDINHYVKETLKVSKEPPTNRSGREYRAVKLAVVAPHAGVMAAAARDALESRGPSLHVARYSLFRKLLRFAGTGPGRDELLSYLFFDRVYAAAQMKLGAEDASKVRDWET